MVETPRRREIEDVASDLFREHGYAATSVRDIARALDIQGASLYAHVASKEDVLWAIVDRAATRFEAAAAAADARAAADGPGDHVARLDALVRTHVAAIAEDVDAAGVFLGEWRSLGPDRRAVILERRDAYERRLRDLIADGMATGAFRMTDPAVATTFVLGALNAIAGWYHQDGRLSPDRIADHAAGFVVSALTDGPT